MNQTNPIAQPTKKTFSVSEPPKGFRPGVTQPSDLLRFEVVRRGAVDFGHLDDVLVEIFGTELVASKNSRVSVPEHELQLGWRVLLVGRDLLQAAGVPALDPGFILTIQHSPENNNANRINSLVPALDYVPAHIVQRAYALACRIIEMLTQQPVNRGEVFTFLDEINTQFVKRSRKILRCGESTVSVIQAAYEQGIPVRHLGRSIYRLGWGFRSLLADRSALESDSAIGARLSHDKYSGARLLRYAGLPAPEHVLVGSEESALDAATKIGWPVVVKPTDRDRGEGITVGLSAPDAVREAYRKAAKYSKSILVEKQVAGVCHRIFVAREEKILFVTERLPKAIFGDGEHTVMELIDQANADEMKTKGNPGQKRLLGTEGDLGEKLGLPADWAYNVIAQVGNYGEVFERNVGPSTPVDLPRGLNALWTEAGGKSPNIVFADAPNLDEAAQAAAGAICFNQGEVCTAGSRLLVEASIKDEFINKVKAAMQHWQPGNPLDPNTNVGAIVDSTQHERVLAYVEKGKNQQATLCCGGNKTQPVAGGFYIEPTMFSNVDNKMAIASDEIFGPVLSVITFNGMDEAIAIANDTPYGLAAGIWTKDLSKAHKMAKAVRAGSVWVNQWDGGDMTAPFGGFKQSGNGRDKSLHAFNKYTEVKATWIKL